MLLTASKVYHSLAGLSRFFSGFFAIFCFFISDGLQTAGSTPLQGTLPTDESSEIIRFNVKIHLFRVFPVVEYVLHVVVVLEHIKQLLHFDRRFLVLDR